MRFSARMKWIGAAAVVVLLAGGFGVARSEGDVVRACVHNVSKQVRIPDDGQCLKNETSNVWNASGPQGPEGPQGPQGETGPAGPSLAVEIVPDGHVDLTPGAPERSVMAYQGLPYGAYTMQFEADALSRGASTHCNIVVSTKDPDWSVSFFAAEQGIFVNGQSVDGWSHLERLGTFFLNNVGSVDLRCQAFGGEAPTVSIQPRLIFTRVGEVQRHLVKGLVEP